MRWVLLGALLLLSLRWWALHGLRVSLLDKAVPQLVLCLVLPVLAAWSASSQPRSAIRVAAWVVAPAVSIVVLLGWAYLHRGAASTIDWTPALLRALFVGLLQWTFIQLLPGLFTVPTRPAVQAAAIGAVFLVLTAPVRLYARFASGCPT